MSTRIEEWLFRMTQAQNPGPAVRVLGVRGGRESPWSYEIHPKTDLALLADRIDQQLRDEVAIHYLLQGVDGDGRVIGTLSYDREPLAQVVPQAAMVPPAVEDTVEYALRSSRSFAGLGFKALIESHEIAKSMIGRLEKENASLRAENAELRKRISDQWEIADRLHCEHIDKQVEADRSIRQARFVESMMQALMAHVAGPKTPAGQTLAMGLVKKFLVSIGPEQFERIFPLLTEEQRFLLATILREETKEEAPEAKTAHDAAASAAAVNGQGARS